MLLHCVSTLRFSVLTLSLSPFLHPPTPRSLQASSQKTSAAPEQSKAPQPALGSEQARPSEDESQEPDLSTLSLAEKMALFNRLAQPATKVTSARPDPRHRRSSARYQTQPITLGEVQQVRGCGGCGGYGVAVMGSCSLQNTQT